MIKVGDLVRDADEYTDQNGYTSLCGVIVEIDEPEGMYKVIWYDGDKEWLTDYSLEVINESR